MRWFFAALVVMLVGCEGGRDVPEAGAPRDSGRFEQIPFVDAGTGNCEDDWGASGGACVRMDLSTEQGNECVIAVTIAFEWCLGAQRVCRENCIFPSIHGGDYQGCLASCDALDAGSSD